MKFRTKIIFSFSVVAFIISSCFGIVHYSFNSRQMTSTAKQNLQFLSKQLADRIDESLDSMKQISDYILSDKEMLNAMKMLPVLHEEEREIERKRQLAVLSSGIITDYIIRNFYRVVIFNSLGDVVCSTSYMDRITKDEKEISEIEWLERADEKKGKVILVAPHKDDWGEKSQKMVFSIARKVQGGNFGYIEIQRTLESLDEILKISTPDIDTMALFPDAEAIYSPNSELETEEICRQLDMEEASKSDIKIVNGKRVLISECVAEKFGVRIVTVQDMNSVLGDMWQLLLLSFLLSVGCFCVFMVMVIIIANRLSRPIKELKEQMEQTRIENLDDMPMVFYGDDELEALNKAYLQLLKRLNEAMVKEKRLSILQLQAQFDTLQAQVNPHFLYNVLNVISSRGMLSGDEEICEICGSLAAMLRYSTNTKERYATVEEELEYLTKYIYLLKSRYEHRLEVEIICEPSIKKEILPKIMLQQLVENSVIHGFNNSKSIMRISVRCKQNQEGWYCEVQDNGQGITDQIQKELEEKIENIRNEILMKKSNVEMEIGGMGLANTFARMFLLYADRTKFQIRNLEQGTSVIIGVTGKSEEEYVSGVDSR